MKKLILVVVALMSVSAFAETSWDELRADRSILIGNPFNAAFGPNGAFNVCVDGDTLASIEPIAYCPAGNIVERVVSDGEGMSHIETSCTEYAYEPISLPRKYDALVCLEERVIHYGNPNDDVPSYECVRWGTEPVTTPTSYDLQVSKVTGEAGIQLLFTKSYDLPACKKSKP